MGAQEFNTVDVVRLEVETDPAGLVNMIPNPNGELGGWGWVTPLAFSQVSGDGEDLSYQYTAAGASYFYSEPMVMSAGQYVAARLVLLAASPPIGINAYTRNRFEFLDAAGAVISSSAQTALVQVGTVNMSAVVAPALTAFVRLRFDMYTSGGANPAGFNAISFNGVTVAKAATSGALQSVRENLIPNPSIETNTTGWTAHSNCAVARSSTVGAVGSWSLRVTATAAGNAEVRTLAGVSGVPVIGGASYTVQARSRSAVTARIFRVGMVWYDATGAVISAPYSTATDSAGAFVTKSHSAVAPAGAVTAAAMVVILGCAAAEVHYVDAVMLEASSGLLSYFDSATADTGTIDYSAQNQTPVVRTRTNYLPNPSLETNATGWTADGPATIARSTAQAFVGTASLAVTKTVFQDYATVHALPGTTGRPFAAGKVYRASAYFRANTTARGIQTGFDVYDSGGALLGSTTPGSGSTDSNGGWERATSSISSADILVNFPTAAYVGFLGLVNNPAVGEVHYVDAAMLEVFDSAGATPLDSYFDGATADGTSDFAVIDRAWTGTAHASTSTETTTLTLPYSRATTSNLSYIEPVQYLNVIAESHEIRVRRNSLNVGELSATIISAALDPSQATLIRPGRRARLTTLISGVWETVMSGKLLEADVTYDLKNPKTPDEKRARIEVLILDPIQALANAKRPEGVATIDELPFVLEGAGVPWNVNGSGNQVFGAAVTTYNDGAFAHNQVALARDTALGYAWMSRLGVLNAWDASEMVAGTLVLDESDYSDLNVSFSTKHCINEVNVVVQSLGVDGTTVETAYGPYQDAASIEEWGPFAKTFTVTGLDAAAVAALAAAVLAANGTPRVRVNSVTLPLTTLARVAAKSLTDLYDQVNVTNVEKDLDDVLRVTSIEHVIDTKAWMVTLSFADEGGVAMPVYQPPVQSGARPDVGVIELFAGPTGNIPPSKLLCDGASKAVADYPYLFAVIGYTFGGAGASFNVPNLTDRFPIGSGTKALGTTGGAATKVLTAANLPPHAHTINHNHELNYSSAAGSGLMVPRGTSTLLGPSNTGINAFNGNSGNGPGASTAVDILNPWLSLNFVIRAV